MLLFFCLYISVVFAPHGTESKELDLNGYIVNIENDILKSVRETPQSSDNLDLSDLNIKEIDRKAFNNLSNVKHLSLANNKLEKLSPLLFLALDNLEHLSLAHNSLPHNERKITKNVFVGLNKLKLLDVRSIFSLSQGTIDFSGLGDSTNVLQDSGESRVPARFYKNETEPYILACINKGIVKSVEIADNLEKLRTVAKNCDSPDVLNNIVINEKNLVDLSEQNIIGFEEGWYHLESLNINFLRLSLNKISRITSAMIKSLPKTLRAINLSENSIERLERGIIDLENLELLFLEKNAINEIDDDALANTKLNLLDLSDNKLKSNKFAKTLPSTMIELNLRNNMIVELLPDAFSKLKQLQILYLNGNKLVSLPKGVFNGLDEILHLSLSNNTLREINVDSFHGLSERLSRLYLDHNEIEKLERGTFINLPVYELHLSHNKIRKVENGTFNATRLVILNLNDNFLTPIAIEDVSVGLSDVRTIISRGNEFIIRRYPGKMCNGVGAVLTKINREQQKNGNYILRVNRFY